MFEKKINNGKVDNDPSQEEKSKLIPESEDEFLNVKKQWKWKPSRLIFLWLFIQISTMLYLVGSLTLIKVYLLNINFTTEQLQYNIGIVLLAILTKRWWKSNDSK